MGRTTLNVFLATVFVAGAAFLLAAGVESHQRYRQAHFLADKAFRATTSPTTLPASPEQFFRQAERATLGIAGLAVVALIVAWRTKHPVWFTCFAACVVIAAIAMMHTGIRH